MWYFLEDIKEAVRVALDENQGSYNMMKDIDTLSLDEMIRSKIEEAVNDVHLAAPVHLLEAGNNFADSIAWDEKPGEGPGWTVLPDDFHRFISFKMTDWERPVYTAILPDDPLYLRQKSRFKGIRGNAQKPVCAIVMRPQGRVMEFYSCKGGEDVSVEMAVFLPLSKMEDEGINICERCYRSVVYKVAGLVAMSMGRDPKLFFTISNEYLK